MTVLTRAGSAATTTGSGRARWILVVLAIGCAASAVNAIGYWTPAPWGDELATQSAAERSTGELLRMAGTTVDAVHALYYLVVHLVASAGGTSMAVLRAPSVLAVGLAASGVAVLGARLIDRRFGVLAAVVFAILPQVSWAATEARSSALLLAASCWTAVALLAALDRGRRQWIGHCLIAALTIALNIYGVLLVAALLVGVLVVPDWRKRALPALTSSAVAVALASPIIVLSLLQAGQVAWLTPFHAGTVRQVVERQWFGDAAGVAVLAWAAVVIALAQAVTGRLGRRELRTVVLSSCCALLPTAVLVAVTILVRPAYAPRYAILSLPFVALLVALPLARLRRTAVVAAILVLGALLATPSFVAQRTAIAKGVDWDPLAATLRMSVRPGEPIWINAADLLSFRIVAQPLLRTHPDIALQESHLSNARLFDAVAPDRVVAARAARHRSVVVVAAPSGWRRSAWLADLRARGFAVTGSTTVSGAPSPVDDAVIVELARTGR